MINIIVISLAFIIGASIGSLVANWMIDSGMLDPVHSCEMHNTKGCAPGNGQYCAQSGVTASKGIR